MCKSEKSHPAEKMGGVRSLGTTASISLTLPDDPAFWTVRTAREVQADCAGIRESKTPPICEKSK